MKAISVETMEPDLPRKVEIREAKGGFIVHDCSHYGAKEEVYEKLDGALECAGKILTSKKKKKDD